VTLQHFYGDFKLIHWQIERYLPLFQGCHLTKKPVYKRRDVWFSCMKSRGSRKNGSSLNLHPRGKGYKLQS